MWHPQTRLRLRNMIDMALGLKTSAASESTLVLTQNPLGRVNLAIILPFHCLIVPVMMRQVASRGLP
jgi:hypothetical protein